MNRRLASLLHIRLCSDCASILTKRNTQPYVVVCPDQGICRQCSDRRERQQRADLSWLDTPEGREWAEACRKVGYVEAMRQNPHVTQEYLDAIERLVKP